MKTTISYYASYRTTDPARPLLGGVRRATSSRFSHREDAQARLDSVIDLHARLDPPLVIDGCIVASARPADLIRHCRTVQVVGSKCPECGVVVENAAEVADGQKVSDLAEVPRAYRAEVTMVNENGNVPGYLKTARTRREIRSVVKMATQPTEENTRPGLRDLNEGQIDLWLRTPTGLRLVAENVQEYDLDKVRARSELIDAVRAALREVLTC